MQCDGMKDIKESRNERSEGRLGHRNPFQILYSRRKTSFFTVVHYKNFDISCDILDCDHEAGNQVKNGGKKAYCVSTERYLSLKYTERDTFFCTPFFNILLFVRLVYSLD